MRIIATGVWPLATLLQLVRQEESCETLATVSLLFPVDAEKTTDSLKCMPKKDETYPKTRHQYASVAPKNHGSVQRGKTVKAKSGWSQNVNWKHNTCYEFSG